MDNPEKLATYGTQDKYKHNKNRTQNVLDTVIRKQTQITRSNSETSLKLNCKYVKCHL
jgi:hypothetical protein